MQMLEIRHVTRYRYARPVRFGEHRMMLRPREDPDQNLLAERLKITPEPEDLRIERDALGNFVAIARFGGASRELCSDSDLIVARRSRPCRACGHSPATSKRTRPASTPGSGLNPAQPKSEPGRDPPRPSPR